MTCKLAAGRWRVDVGRWLALGVPAGVVPNRQSCLLGAKGGGTVGAADEHVKPFAPESMRKTPLMMLTAVIAIPGVLAAQSVSTAVHSEPKIAWDLTLRYRDVSAMAETDGVIVTGNTSGQGGTFAYDAATGRQLWTVPGHIRGGPAVQPGFAYAVNDTRDRYRFRLSKLAIKTGKVVWSATEEDLGNHDGPPLLVDGQVVLVSRNRVISAYDDATGARIWHHEGVRICDGKLSAVDGLVFFSGGLAGSEAMLTALNAKTGATVWSAKLVTQSGSTGCGAMTVVDRGIVVIGIGRDLLAFDAKSGARRWGRMVAPTVAGRAQDLALSQLVVAGGAVLSASPTSLLGWDLETGATVFAFALPATMELSSVRLTGAEDVLYLAAKATGDGADRAAYLYAISLAGRGLLWRHHVARTDKYDTVGSWPTRYVLPLKDALVYESSQRLVKLVP